MWDTEQHDTAVWSKWAIAPICRMKTTNIHPLVRLVKHFPLKLLWHLLDYSYDFFIYRDEVDDTCTKKNPDTPSSWQIKHSDSDLSHLKEDFEKIFEKKLMTVSNLWKEKAPERYTESLTGVKYVLKFGAGVLNVKSFFTDRIICVESDDNCIPSWVNFIRRLQ